jgi:hypothetical protein
MLLTSKIKIFISKTCSQTPSVHKDRYLLGCSAVQSGRRLPPRLSHLQLSIIRGEVKKFQELFYINSLALPEFVPPGKSVTDHLYEYVSQMLRNAVRLQGQWFLHHDNSPSHTSLVVQQFLAERDNSVTAVLSELAPYLKMGIKGTCFATMENTK